MIFAKGTVALKCTGVRALIFLNQILIEFSRIFYTYLNSNFTVFPDGRGRYYQPEIILELFDLILSVYNTEQKRKLKAKENGK